MRRAVRHVRIATGLTDHSRLETRNSPGLYKEQGVLKAAAPNLFALQWKSMSKISFLQECLSILQDNKAVRD